MVFYILEKVDRPAHVWKCYSCQDLKVFMLPDRCSMILLKFHF